MAKSVPLPQPSVDRQTNHVDTKPRIVHWKHEKLKLED